MTTHLAGRRQATASPGEKSSALRKHPEIQSFSGFSFPPCLGPVAWAVRPMIIEAECNDRTLGR